jgi:hypothetical protein
LQCDHQRGVVLFANGKEAQPPADCTAVSGRNYYSCFARDPSANPYDRTELYVGYGTVAAFVVVGGLIGYGWLSSRRSKHDASDVR